MLICMYYLMILGRRGGWTVSFDVSFSSFLPHFVVSTTLILLQPLLFSQSYCSDALLIHIYKSPITHHHPPYLLKVETMFGTFAMALQFTGGGIGSWDVSSCMDMMGMFYIAVAFDEDLSGWDVSKVLNMYGMFAAATSFRGIGLENWDVSSVAYSHGMFYDATVFNADVSKWDVSSVTDMSNMFNGARSFNHPLGAWNISGLPFMYGILTRAESFNQDLCAWGDQFPYTQASNNFLDSGCTLKEDPTIEERGPFCASFCLEEQ